MTAALAATELCVFDAYGTLFDVHSVIEELGAAPDSVVDWLDQLPLR